MGGYLGKLLRIDLTKEKISEENIPEKNILRTYIGGLGLGLRQLYNELPLGTKPLDPENPLIFMTGPLTGTMVPAPTNTTCTTLNSDTGFTAGRSHSHGFWGPYLKFAGYDGLIIQGAAKKPIYLWICDGKVEIRDASKIWGKDTHETEDLVKKELGQPRVSVAAIGPAGENLCHGALIENDKNHSFSHSGTGTVMGSKKLKAIAVHGTGRVPVADKNKLREVAKMWLDNLRTAHRKRGKMWGRGISKSEFKYSRLKWLFKKIREKSVISAKNFLEVNPPEFGEGISKYKLTPRPCFACILSCAYDAEITSGPKKGYIATLSGGAENLEGSSSIFGVYESGTALYLSDLMDRLGFEGSTTGCAMSLAFECYEKGLLTKEDTDGLELKWGDAEVVEKLLMKIVKREGWIGNALAKGPKRAGEAIGGDAPKFAIHVKGAGMCLHDWRARWGVLFGQIVGGGSGWPAPGSDTWAPESEAGYSENTDPLSYKGKPDEVRKTGMIKNWNDCIGTCWFSTWGVPESLTLTSAAYSAATGLNVTREETLILGERLMNLERVFNVRHGLTPMDDWDVSPRIVEAQPSGPGKGKSMAPHVKGMVMEYYRLMGWDEKTGKPWSSTLKRLGLEDTIKDIWAC